MRKLVTALAVVAALIWSALIWGGYAILALTTDLLVGGAGGIGLSPELDQLAIWFGSFVDRFGTGTAAVIWAIGLLAIWLIRSLINGLLGAAQSRPTRQHDQVAPPPSGAPLTPVDRSNPYGRSDTR